MKCNACNNGDRAGMFSGHDGHLLRVIGTLTVSLCADHIHLLNKFLISLPAHREWVCLAETLTLSATAGVPPSGAQVGRQADLSLEILTAVLERIDEWAAEAPEEDQ